MTIVDAMDLTGADGEPTFSVSYRQQLMIEIVRFCRRRFANTGKGIGESSSTRRCLDFRIRR
jgi:hypothetical protein